MRKRLKKFQDYKKKMQNLLKNQKKVTIIVKNLCKKTQKLTNKQNKY